MNPWQRAWAVVREFRRTYLVINIAYYGLVGLSMVYAAFNPALQNTLMQSVGVGFSEGPLAPVGAAYGSGSVPAAIALTFVVNLFLGALLVITLPSLLIPFSGLLVGIYRAVLWGLMLSPAHPDLRLPMLPHMLTLIIEGQAYILAMLGAYVQARAFLWPKAVGATGHGRGYLAGLQRTAWLYVLVITCLAVAAVYEALEVILMMRLLG